MLTTFPRRHTSSIILAAGLAAPAASFAQANWSESFDGISTQSSSTGPSQLSSRGWAFRNQSSPTGAHGYYLVTEDTNSIWPDPHAGTAALATDDFAASGSPGADLNAWAVLPAISNQRAGDLVTFYAYAHTTTSTLELRYAPSGNGTGSAASDVGSFTQLLTSVPAGDSWVRYQVAVPGTGRLAFRYAGDRAGWGTFSDFVLVDTLSVGVPPAPPCNMPPVPAAGQTVHWTAAAPYRVCQNITIPAGGTVIVDPGAVVTVDANTGIAINGALRALGTAAQPISISHAANFPPMLAVNGELTTAYTTLAGQVRPNAGGSLSIADTTFNGPNGVIHSDLYTGTGFGRFERVTFNNSEFTIANYTLVLDGVTLNNSSGHLLRDYTFLANVVADGKPFDVDAARQGTALDTITVRNVQGPPGGQTVSTGYGLGLNEGNFALGPAVTLTNNTFPIRVVSAGILPGSAVSSAGNTNNSIYVPGRDHHGNVIWSSIGLPYFIADFYAQHGGSLRIEEGVTVKIAAGAGMAQDPSLVSIYGTPQHPVNVGQAIAGQPWFPLQAFHRIRHANLDGATRAAAWPSQLGWGFLDSSTVTNCTEYGVTGQAIVRKTLFQNNAVAAAVSFNGLDLLGDTNPNAFENNTVGVASAGNASYNWWNSPTGPTSPDNPGGTGDSKANGVPFQPFRTERPDFNDSPPVVTLEKHAFMAVPGEKVILTWKASDDRAIVSQKVYMVADGDVVQGNLIEPIVTVADNLPGTQRSIEFVMPEPASRFFGTGNIRVESTDDAGQVGWDDLWMYAEHQEQGQLVLTSPLTPAVTAGANLGSVCWQAQGITPTGGVINARLVLENTGESISLGGVTTYLNCLPLTLTAPFASTDRARVVLDLFTGGGRSHPEYYYGPVFSIRPDNRVGDAAPTVAVTSPPSGGAYAGGQVVPIRWAAADDRSMRAFHIQQSTDGGRTWSFIVRDLPGTAASYDWVLPTSTGTPGVQIKVVAVDRHFQDTSSLRAFSITPGTFTPPAACAADIGAQGGVAGSDGILDNNDFVAFIDYFFNADPRADLGGQGGQPGADGRYDNNDFIVFIDRFFQGCG